MKAIYIFTFISIILYSCHSKTFDNVEDTISITDERDTTLLKLEIKTIFNDTIGWGYQIYQNGNLYINQPHIPAIQGYQGFENENIARKVGKYICWKIEKGIIPPTISPEELDSLMY